MGKIRKMLETRKIMINKSKATQKFCILTTQRSGSTWLSTILDSNPKIQGFRELFIDQEFVFPDSKLDTFLLYKKNNSSKKRPQATFEYLHQLDNYIEEREAIGFKLMYDQLIDYPEIIVKLIQEKYKIIHLVRENYLDAIISSKIKDEQGIVHTKVKIEPKEVYLEPNWLVKRLNKQAKKIRIANIFLSLMPNQVLNITYNDLRVNQEQTLSSISNFLELSLSREDQFKSELKKSNNKSHQQIIKNYNEVNLALAGTKFFPLLNK